MTSPAGKTESLKGWEVAGITDAVKGEHLGFHLWTLFMTLTRCHLYRSQSRRTIQKPSMESKEKRI